MAPVSRHRRTGDPRRGWWRSQASNRGEERAKQAAERIRNTVPGRSGRTSPAIPTPRNSQPSPNRSGRRKVAALRLDARVGGGSCGRVAMALPRSTRCRHLSPGPCSNRSSGRNSFLATGKVMSVHDPQLPLIGDPGALPGRRSRARIRLRNYFLTGLIVAGPLTITIYITWWFITLVDGWVKPLVPQRYLPETYLPFPIPGFGLIIAFTGLTLLGFLTANLVGRTLLDIGELVLNRMPVVRGIYRGTKQVFETIFSTTGT